MASSKHSSYPSRQLRQGPAPLASFEDLSDEVESPSEKNCHPLPEIEEELKLYADSVTPSTPRLLATTPSTPRAVLSCASTPQTVDINSLSWDAHADSEVQSNEDVPGSSSRATSQGTHSKNSLLDDSREIISQEEVMVRASCKPSNSGIKNSISSSFMDDVRGAEAASALAHSLPERSATPECLPQKTPVKKGIATSSHLHALRSESGLSSSRTPSRTPSPKSPRRLFSFFKHTRDEGSEPGSPSSPKSPRKSFTNLFKIGRDDHDQGSSSPTKKRPSLSIFFKGNKEDSKSKREGGFESEEIVSKTKKEASNRNVFATLFKKNDKRSDKKSPVRLTLQATSVDIPIDLDPIGTGWTSREISLHSHLTDLQQDEPESSIEPEQQQEKIKSPIFNGDLHYPIVVDVYSEPTKEISIPAITTENEKSKHEMNQKTPVLSEEEIPKLSDNLLSVADEKISSGSEQESDFDPVSLKRKVTEDYEAETLIDEDMDYDDFPPAVLPVAPELTKLPPVTPVRRLQDMTTIPIERPRSSTPLNLTSLEAYIQTASPPLERATGSEVEKIKVCLPGEEFTSKGKSPRKMSVKNWQDFCQEVLQSPRTRRRDDMIQSGNNGASLVQTTSVSSPPPSWVTFESIPEMIKSPRLIKPVPAKTDVKSDSLPYAAESSVNKKLPSPKESPEEAPKLPPRESPSVRKEKTTSVLPLTSVEDCECECHKLYPSVDSTKYEVVIGDVKVMLKEGTKKVISLVNSKELSSSDSGESLPPFSERQPTPLLSEQTETPKESVSLENTPVACVDRAELPLPFESINLPKAKIEAPVVKKSPTNNSSAIIGTPDLIKHCDSTSANIRKSPQQMLEESSVPVFVSTFSICICEESDKSPLEEHSSDSLSSNGVHLDCLEGVDPLLDGTSESEDQNGYHMPEKQEVLYPPEEEEKRPDTSDPCSYMCLQIHSKKM